MSLAGRTKQSPLIQSAHGTPPLHSTRRSLPSLPVGAVQPGLMVRGRVPRIGSGHPRVQLHQFRRHLLGLLYSQSV